MARGTMGAALAAMVAIGACRDEIPPAASSPPATRTEPRKRVAEDVEQVRDWTVPKRPTPTARKRNPFRFGTAAGHEATEAPIAPGVSSDSLPELPLPIPASDLRLIGIVGADDDDGRLTAIVTVANDLVFARVGDTIAARYRVVGVSEDSLDVIDAAGNLPRHLSIR